MAIPRLVREIEEDKMIVELRLLNVRVTLTLNKNLCVGCGICATACPKEAIERGPVGASKRGLTKLPPVIVNEQKCSLCGLCDILCPFGAMELRINGEHKLILKEQKAVPELKYEEVECPKYGIKAKKYFEGEITINSEKCPGGCSTCADVCPTGAITIPKPSKGWERVPKVEVDKEKCIFCGTCVYACPAEGAIELRRTKVLWEGEHTEFWNEVVQKLLQPLKS